MFRSIFTVSVLTFLGKIVGFLRVKLIYHHLGIGSDGDVWSSAYMIPIMFRRIFGDGAFVPAFVPCYCKQIREGDFDNSNQFASRVLTFLFFFLLVVFCVLFFGVKPLVSITNPGFLEDGRFDSALITFRFTLIYLVLLSLSVFFGAVLNGRNRFIITSSSQIIFNSVIIGVLILVTLYSKSNEPLKALCIGIVIAGLVQFVVLVFGVARSEGGIRFAAPTFDPRLKHLLLLMMPGVMAGIVQQIGALFGRVILSKDVGAQSSLYLCDRVIQLPIAIIGVAIGTVLLPQLAKALRFNDTSKVNEYFAKSSNMAVLLAVLILSLFIAFPDLIMFTLFAGGEIKDTTSLAPILVAFAFGIPASIFNRVYQSVYFAHENTKTPMKFSIVSAVLSVLICYPLYLWKGAVGVALSGSIASWVYCLLLGIGIINLKYRSFSPDVLLRYLGVICCGLITAGIISKMYNSWGAFIYDGGKIVCLGALIVLSLIGCLVFIGLILSFCLFSFLDLRQIFDFSREK